MKNLLIACLMLMYAGVTGQNLQVFYVDGQAVVKEGKKEIEVLKWDTISPKARIELTSGSLVVVNENGRHILVNQPGTYTAKELTGRINDRAFSDIDKYFLEVYTAAGTARTGRPDASQPVKHSLANEIECDNSSAYPKDSALLMEETITFTWNGTERPAWLHVYQGDSSVWKQQWGAGNNTVVRVPENFKVNTWYQWAVCTNEGAKPYGTGWNKFRIMPLEEKTKYLSEYNMLNERLATYPAELKQQLMNAFADGRQVVH
jgi:hypothetical protein